MKKSVVFALLVCCFTLFTSVAGAYPAPPMKQLIISNVGSEYTGWANVNYNAIVKTPNQPLVGENLYVAVQFNGYPKSDSTFLYVNGNFICNSTVTNICYRRDPINNPATGYVYYYRIPFTSLGIQSGSTIGSISVKSTGVNGGYAESYVNNIQFTYK